VVERERAPGDTAGMGAEARRHPGLVHAWLIGASAALACALPACDAPPRAAWAPEPGVLRIGVQAWDMPSRVEESFLPVEQALEGALVHHGAGLAVEIVPFAVYGELVAALAQGRVDVARLESGSYLSAAQREPGIALLAVERPARGTPRQGLIVTSVHATIDTLDELRGKRVAFGDEHASLGRYLPQAALLAAGLRATELGAMAYLRRGDKIAAAVRLGEFDAGVIDAETFRRVNVDGSLRVLSPLIDAPRPWVARAGMSGELVAALATALLELDDAHSLRVLDAGGFDAATPDTYEPARAAMVAAAAFAAGSDLSRSPPPARWRH
jgi:phosphonate transport system substrate-binding protein